MKTINVDGKNCMFYLENHLHVDGNGQEIEALILCVLVPESDGTMTSWRAWSDDAAALEAEYASITDETSARPYVQRATDQASGTLVQS